MNTAPFVSAAWVDGYQSNRDYKLTEIFSWFDADGAQDLKSVSVEFTGQQSDSHVFLPTGKLAKGITSLTPAAAEQAKLHTSAQGEAQFLLHVKVTDAKGASAHARVVSSGGASDTIKIAYAAESGHDVYFGGGGNDTFDGTLAIGAALFASPAATFTAVNGGAGLDRMKVSGTRDSFKLQKGMGEGEYQLQSKSLPQTLQLRHVERLEFGDQKVTLQWDDNCARASKLVSALFGKSALADKEIVGKVLTRFDQGYTYAQVAEAAIADPKFKALAGSTSNSNYVKLVYKNVTGKDAPASEHAFYTQLLDQGQFTQASISVFAAECGANQYNVDLVGLAQSGLSYV